MKVSSKFILGFIVLTLLAVVILAYQWSSINELQRVNIELSSINIQSARTELEIKRWMAMVEEDTKKFFLISLYPIYENQLQEVRTDLHEYLNRLRETS